MGIIDTEVQRFTQMADRNGITYYIVMPDGAVHGKPPEPPKKAITRAPRAFPHGTFTRIFETELQDMQPGDVREIKSDLIDPEHLRKGLCSAASERWGVKTYTSAVTDKHVEFMRLA